MPTTTATTGPAPGPTDEGPAVPRRSAVLGLALLAPPAVAGGLHLLGDRVAPATAVLVLVLVVVAASAAGLRSAGALAALSAGVSFDYFLVSPRLSLTIADPNEVGLTALLLVTGLAVSELALWGRRQQARAGRRAGYLDGVLGTADALDVAPERLAAQVARRLVDVLEVADCRFEPRGVRGRASSATTLHRDGSVTRYGAPVDVAREGLPTDDLVALEVVHAGAGHGRFLLAASTRVVRPSPLQLRVAGLLADQVARAFVAADEATGARTASARTTGAAAPAPAVPGREPGPAVRRDSGRGAGRDSGQSAGRDRGQGAGRDSGQVAGRDRGQGVGRDQGQGAGRDSGQGAGRGQGQRAGRDPGQGAGRGQGPVAGRGAPR